MPDDTPPPWEDVFRLVRRRRIGGGPKVTSADELHWSGVIDGRRIEAVSRVRLNCPQESFVTPSNMRLRDSFVGRCGHYVDLRVPDPVSDEALERIRRMAAAADDREVVVSRGRHPPARVSLYACEADCD